jgi:hypothetical protein
MNVHCGIRFNSDSGIDSNLRHSRTQLDYIPSGQSSSDF